MEAEARLYALALDSGWTVEGAIPSAPLEALRLAREAGERGEVPIGAVALFEGRIVGRGANAREGDRDPSGDHGVS